MVTKQQRLVLIVGILASVVANIDGFIVNVALPTIAHQLGGGLMLQQWTVDAYLITLGTLILVAGSLSDLLGRKRILAIGLVWFGATSLLCAVAPNGTFLVIARALQGAGGALLVPSSLALIISVFSGQGQSKAIGSWTSWLSVATVIGPVLGGVILAIASWRWIFLVNVAPIAFTLYLLSRLEEPEHATRNTSADILGAVLCTLGLGFPVYALIEQPLHGWGSMQVWLSSMLGILLLASFFWHELRTAQPMLPLLLFKVRNFSFGNIATLVIYAGLSVSSFLITITLQQVGGYSAFKAALAIVPISAVMFLMSGRFSEMAGRYGPRLFMTAGPVLAAVGFILMLRVQPHVRYVADLLPGILLFALGLSMIVAPLTSAVLSDVALKHAGIASAVNNAIARIAGLVSIASLGIVVGPRLNIHGFHRALLCIAALMIAGSLVSLLGIRNNSRVPAA
jgi:EmrB/QacA subfamily drug resistance transporter